jgi:hypothetical protein
MFTPTCILSIPLQVSDAYPFHRLRQRLYEKKVHTLGSGSAAPGGTRDLGALYELTSNNPRHPHMSHNIRVILYPSGVFLAFSFFLFYFNKPLIEKWI